MSDSRGSPSVSDVSPSLPNDGTGLPVCESSENNLERLLRKMRILFPSRQNAGPRSFHPLPDKTCPSLYPSPSKRHSSLPLSASIAAMLLYGVVTYSTPSIINGVASKKPGVVPYSLSGVSQCCHCQATCNRCTFCGLMPVSAEYRVFPWSPP